MSLRTCPKHGPYIADTSTDFGETWCPECGPQRSAAERLARVERELAEAAAVLRILVWSKTGKWVTP